MNGLEHLQALFQGHVISGAGDAATVFVGDATASAHARLGVYYDAYRLRLIEVLRNDFPGLFALMGDEAFHSLALRYLEKHPSHHPNARWFGRRLAEFLDADGDFAPQPMLAEMARFEWAQGLVFDAGDAELLTSDELAQTPADDWPSMRLRFHPALQRIPISWNIGPIWQAVSAKDAIPQSVKLGKAEQWVVWRRDLRVYWRALDGAEACALDAFRDGGDFTGVCTALCDWLDEEKVPAETAGMLRRWVADGLVAR